MGACAGLIKSVLKHFSRLWTDVLFVESCARWRLQGTLLEVIALAALLAQPSQILFSLNRVQTCTWGGDRTGHYLPAHAASWATVSSAECSKRVSWLLPLWFIVSVRERGAPASQGTVWEHRGQAGLGTAGSAGAFICSFPKLGWEQEPVPLLVMVHSLWVRSFGEWQGLDVLAPLVYQGLGVGLS